MITAKLATLGMGMAMLGYMGNFGGPDLLPCICFPVFGGIALLLTVFWIWTIIDVVTNEPSEGNDKVVWLLVVILVHWIGSAIYYFVRRPERIRKYGK